MNSNTPDTELNESDLLDLAGPMRRALQAYAANRLGEAEFNCRLILAANKKHFDAVQLLGHIEFQRGKFDDAYSLFRRAVRLNPRSISSRINLGLALQQLGRSKEALASLDQALELDPSNVLALNNRGHILWQLKRPDEALESLNRALILKHDDVDALCNRGNVYVELLRFEDALSDYNHALAINPHDPPTLNNRANVLWALERHEEALQSYDEAAALDPNDLSILKDRGSALLYMGRGEEALACFDHALTVKPDDIYFLYKRGAALAGLDRYEEALDCFDRALASQPDYVEALDNRGNALAALQRAADAIASYDRALAIKPETAETHWNRALTLLRIGDYDQGWKEYEWRWKLSGSNWKPREFTRPLWLGDQPIAGKTILLHAEQGFGDAIQFLRYAPLVAALGAKVIVETQPALKTLASCIEGVSLALGRGEALPEFDCHCPLLSLPLAFKTKLESIPAQVPYLSVAPERLSAWRERLPKSDSPRIALAWAGNQQFPGDKSRSIGLPRLESLLSASSCQFVSIQKDLRPGDAEILRAHSNISNVGAELADFSDTAAVISLCDLVISSDTAVVHLAGALGRPVWILLEHTPDWRWLLERENSPWYPNARLFRQPKAGDWEGAVARCAEALEEQFQTRDRDDQHAAVRSPAKAVDASLWQSQLERATSAHRHGALADAERLYDEVLRHQPNNVDALHRLGVIAAQTGRAERAVELIESAIKLDPTVTNAHSNLGNALLDLRRPEEALASYDRAIALESNDAELRNCRGLALHDLKRFDEAIASYDDAIALRADFAEAFFNRGNALGELKRLVEAVESYNRAIALKPEFSEAYDSRGTVLRHLKRSGEALESYDKAIALKPDLADTHLNRGVALQNMNRVDDALISFDRAIALKSDFAEAYSNRGNVLRELERNEEAFFSFDKAIELKPDLAQAYFNRGNALQDLRRLNQALIDFDKAIMLKPDFADAHLNRGIALQELNRLDEALVDFDRAITLNPSLADAQNNKASALLELGRIQESREAYLAALQLDPNLIGAYLNLSRLKTFSLGDPLLATMELLAAKPDGLSDADRISLDLALSKAYADLEDYGRSFTHLAAGNARKRATISYNEKSVLDWFDRIEAVFTPELIAAKEGGGSDSSVPIFVLGMPRSGTTLVEQILASHPQVRGAGELRTLNNILYEIRDRGNVTVPYPEVVRALDALALRGVGERYIAELRKLESGGERVTDKMPFNFLFIGLIHLALPNARIVHTLRDPVDTCISCFSHLFTDDLNCSYDLGEIGRYYKRYERLMAHWHRILPVGRVLDVRYENVVAELESEARRILSYCGLPWDDRCLHFHETERPIRTPSAAQVRQPIYNSAVGRWRVYGEQLAPLLNALGIGSSAR